MSKQIVNIRDGLSKNMKDDCKIGGGNLRGSVEMYEKNPDGSLGLLGKKDNLIVNGGREWLLRKAFGSSLIGNSPNIYNKTINWFSCGQGGGEPGNPLQAGATIGSDDWLLSPVRLRSDLVEGVDPGYSSYASDPTTGDHGYFKQFSTIVVKEDHSNPYVKDGITKYPSLIAEIRIELSSDDANGVDGTSGWVDLNEAGLFISDPTESDPGLISTSGGVAIGDCDVINIVKDGDYSIYILDSVDVSTDVPLLATGDYLYVSGSTSTGNDIDEESPLLIVDIYNGEVGRSGYVIVENSSAIDEEPTSAIAHFINKQIEPYEMFSRVTFSTLRKTQDREIVFLWKIYF